MRLLPTGPTWPSTRTGPNQNINSIIRKIDKVQLRENDGNFLCRLCRPPRTKKIFLVMRRSVVVVALSVLSGCSDNTLRGSENGGDESSPPAPVIRQGKHSKKFSKDNLCELDVYSNRPFGAEPVLEHNVDACLEHPDTTQVKPGSKGYAYITFGGGEARGDQMGV